MSTNKIILLSNPGDMSENLVSKLRSENYSVSVSRSLDQAISRFSSSEVVMILINYLVIKGADKKDLPNLFRNSGTTKFVIFDVPNDATRRRAFYRLGAYRILSSRYTVDDLFYFCRNILQKVETNGKLKEAHFSGSLEDFNLGGLISIFGREKRDGILRIRTKVSTGKIYFSHGNIVHAVSGSLRDDNAVFYMLTWTKGWFSMRPLPLKTNCSQVQLSNIGLLLYGEQINSVFLKNVNNLGGINRQLRVINQGDILQVNKDKTFAEFINYLSEFRKIYEIIEFSPYPMLETLDIITQMNQSKNLEFRETVSGIGEIYVEKAQKKPPTGERILCDTEVAKLRNILGAAELTSGKLLILGSGTCGKTDFIRSLTQGSHNGVRTNQNLDFTKIDLANDFYLQVFGIALDKHLTNIVEKLSEGLLGYVFLVDAEQPKEFEYTSYIINHLTGMFDVPWTIAVTNIDVKNNKLLKKIKSDIRVPDNRKLLICDVTNKEDVIKVIMSMASMEK